MTATDELRRMLDEADVEWDYGITGAASTMFNANGVELTFIDMRDGVTCSTILTPAQAIAATLGGDNSDTVKRLMKLQGGHYSWPRLYEAVTGDPFDYDCSPSESEEVFIEKLISIVGGRKVVDA